MARKPRGHAEIVPEVPGRKLTIIEQIERRTSAFSLQVYADLMGIKYSTAYDMYRDGRLPAMRVGTSIRVDPATAAELLRRHSTT